MRKFNIVLLVLAVIAAVLVGGDFYGVYGSHRILSQQDLSVRFLPVDSVTGKPITGVHLVCTLGPGAKGAHQERPCTQRGDASDGVVNAQFVLVRPRRHTWLFDKGSATSGEPRGDLTLVFIHPDYQRLFMRVPMSALPGMAEHDNKVQLTHADDGKNPGRTNS